MTIAIRDIQANNGVLHIVERVLNPAQKTLVTGPSEGSLVSTGDSNATVPVATATPVSVNIPTTVAVPSTPDPTPVASAAPDSTDTADSVDAEADSEEESLGSC